MLIAEGNVEFDQAYEWAINDGVERFEATRWAREHYGAMLYDALAMTDMALDRWQASRRRSHVAFDHG